MQSIAIVGPDGSGKTTQARMLRDWLVSDGFRCAHEHQYGGRQSKRGERIAVRAHRTSLLGDLPYVVRVAFAACVQVHGAVMTWRRMRRYRHKATVVLDRYYPDVMLRCAWRLGVVPEFGWTLWKVLPKPDVIFSLKIDYELGCSRKKDGSLTAAEYRRKADLAAAINEQAYTGTAVYSIDVSALDIHTVHARIRSHVEDYCSTRSPERT